MKKLFIFSAGFVLGASIIPLKALQFTIKQAKANPEDPEAQEFLNIVEELKQDIKKLTPRQLWIARQQAKYDLRFREIVDRSGL